MEDGLYIIEIDFNKLIDMGTRQSNPQSNPYEDLIPDVDAGFVYNENTGLIAGTSVNGEIITTPTTKESVEEFSENPLEITSDPEEMDFEATELEYDEGFVAPPAFPIGIVIGVVLIIVVIVVVVLLTRKKTPPVHQHPEQYQQQPPPPPTEYQPDGQYQQQPLNQQYQQPPPPPPGQ